MDTVKGVGTGPAGPVLAGPLFNSLAYMVTYKIACLKKQTINFIARVFFIPVRLLLSGYIV